MRVSLVIQKLAGLRGGAERVFVDLANGLAARGHDVTVATFEPVTGEPGYDLAQEITFVDLFPPALRLVPHRVATPARVNAVEGATSRHANRPLVAHAKWHATHGIFARRAASWLRRSQQDVVVGFLPPAISAVAHAGARLGERSPRVIASTHNLPVEDFGNSARWDQNPETRRRNLWALAAADIVTVLQPEFVDQLPVGARPTAVVIPDPVTRLGPLQCTDREQLVIGVGRLVDVKRFDLLVEAFALIAPSHPRWRVEIFGDGDERDRLELLIKRHRLTDRVIIRDAVSDIAHHYDRARILCHPARFEGFGLSVAEGILHGLHVLAFADCLGVNRLVEHGATGLLVAPDSPADEVAAFARGLGDLIESPPDETLRASAATRLRDRLAPDQILDRWERVLASG